MPIDTENTCGLCGATEASCRCEAKPPVRSSELVGLLASGLEAAEGAQVIMNLYFERDNRDPYNNDNYCRMCDWIKDARRALGKQPNSGVGE